MRTSASDLEASAAAALLRALEHVGLDVGAPSGRGPDTVLVARIDGREVLIVVEAKAYGTGAQVADAVARTATVPGQVPLLVADKITAEARDRLKDAGWSWFDRRGRLHLTAAGIRVDVDVPADPRVGLTPTQADPIGGPGGLAVAYWLCAHPGQPVSPTRLTSSLGFAPSTISTAHRRLANAGLVGSNGAGLFPELFWELAGAWRPERVWVATPPDPQPRPADAGSPRWRRTGTAAAVAYGAPVVSTRDDPVELYLPGPVEISVVLRRHQAAEPGTGAASLAVAPVRAVTAAPEDGDEPPLLDGWSAAPLLAVALDLAKDRSRGREILEDWEISGAVWR